MIFVSVSLRMNLKDEILKLTNTAPVIKDDQDISDDDTAAKICSNEFDDELAVNGGNNRKFRSFIDLSEVSDTYKGKVVSRSKLNGLDDYSENEDEEEADDDEEMEEEEDEDEDEDDEGVDEDIDDDDDDDDDDDNENVEKRKQKTKVSDDHDIQMFNSDKANSEIAKGLAIRNQINFWETLLDNRMKFQNLLTDINQYPRHDELDYFINESNQNTKSLLETNENLTIELINELNDLTNNLSNITKKSAETDLNMDDDDESESESEKEDDEDDEIESDEDSHKKNKTKNKRKKKQTKKPIKIKKYKKLKYDELDSYLDKDYNEFIEYRNLILQKWYERTSVFVSKGNIPLEKPIMQQIENLLLDKKRIIKRTQLKRITYEQIKKPKETDEQEKKDVSTVASDEHDVEIFDDYDFYQQLLRELVNRRTFDITDPILLSKHSIELQKLQMKKKKNIDTKASKGRKIRFDIHKNLVNFMVPIHKSTMAEDAKNDLFSALFENHTTFGIS